MLLWFCGASRSANLTCGDRLDATLRLLKLKPQPNDCEYMTEKRSIQVQWKYYPVKCYRIILGAQTRFRHSAGSSSCAQSLFPSHHHSGGMGHAASGAVPSGTPVSGTPLSGTVALLGHELSSDPSPQSISPSHHHCLYYAKTCKFKRTLNFDFTNKVNELWLYKQGQWPFIDKKKGASQVIDLIECSIQVSTYVGIWLVFYCLFSIFWSVWSLFSRRISKDYKFPQTCSSVNTEYYNAGMCIWGPYSLVGH